MKKFLELLDGFYKETIKGGEKGEGHGKKPSDFNSKDLLKGMVVELEHSDDELVAMELVIDHLAEDEKYYDKLEKIEAPEAETAPEAAPEVEMPMDAQMGESVDSFGLPLNG